MPDFYLLFRRSWLVLCTRPKSLHLVHISTRSEVRDWKGQMLQRSGLDLMKCVCTALPSSFVPPVDYSSEDQLLWRPDVLPVQDVEEFLLFVQRPCGQEGAAGTQGDTVRDNEQVEQCHIACWKRPAANLCSPCTTNCNDFKNWRKGNSVYSSLVLSTHSTTLLCFQIF